MTEGVEALSIQGVAKAAGVQRSTVYNHWPDRLALIVDALADFANEPDSPHEQRQGGEAIDLVRAIVLGLGRNLRSDWGIVASSLAAAAEHDPELAQAHRDFVLGQAPRSRDAPRHRRSTRGSCESGSTWIGQPRCSSALSTTSASSPTRP